MVQIKQLLDTRRAKSDGTFTIIFRITNFTKVYTIGSGIAINIKYWNSLNSSVSNEHPNAQELNVLLSKKFYEIQNAVLHLTNREEFSIDALRMLLKGKPKYEHYTFKSFSEKLILEMFEVNRTGNAIVYQTALNRLLAYSANPKMKFEDLNYNILDGFSRALTLEGKSVNTIGNYFRSIRAIYNKAIKARIVDRSHYPFHDIKIKSERTLKRAVLRQDLAKLEQLNLDKNKAEWNALNSFLLSFYLIGISFTDLAYLTNKNIIDGRLVYRRRKTHKNYSIKLFPQAEAILNNFYKEGSKYLIPVLPDHIEEDSLRAKQLIHQWIKTTNKYIKKLGQEVGITATLTTYVARHTFATTAKRLGYSNELIAEALGHEYGNKITNIYLDSFDQEVVNEMHRRVIAPLEEE